MKPVTMINCFEIPVGGEDEFYGKWSKVNEHQKTQPGFLSQKMHRALAPDARYLFINVVQFETLELYQASVASGSFRALSDSFGPEWHDFKRTGLGPFEVATEFERTR